MSRVVAWGLCCLQMIQGFAAELGCGVHPYSSLTAVTAPATGHLVLYGTTVNGGPGNYGTLFSYDTENNNYTDLVNFTWIAGAHPGAYPYGSLIAKTSPSTGHLLLYGTAAHGGRHNSGVLFSYDTNTGNYTDLVTFTGVMGPHYGAFPHGALAARGGLLYGMTTSGSALENSSYGVVFAYDTRSGRYTDLVNFTGTWPHFGAYPNGSLTLLIHPSTGHLLLYGLTAFGGVNNYGVLFVYDTDTGNYIDLVDFTGTVGPSFGAYPYGSLTAVGRHILYGTTSNGGSSNHGVLFSYDISTGNYADLIDFTGMTGPFPGAHPYGPLTAVVGPSTGHLILYGTTANGGSKNLGVLFSYDTNTGTYTDLVDFTGTTGPHHGANPHSSLTPVVDPSTGHLLLYGTTTNGGFNNQGVLFSYDTQTGNYTNLVDFIHKF